MHGMHLNTIEIGIMAVIKIANGIIQIDTIISLSPDRGILIQGPDAY